MENELSFTKMMELANHTDIKGRVKASNSKFKVVSGKMYVFNAIRQEWIKPSITTNWFNHKYMVRGLILWGVD